MTETLDRNSMQTVRAARLFRAMSATLYLRVFAMLTVSTLRICLQLRAPCLVLHPGEKVRPVLFVV